MSTYRISGNHELRGTVRISGNKNAALPCLVACLLTDEAIIIRNVPEIEDIRTMIELLGYIGCSVERIARGVYELKTQDIHNRIDPINAEKIRASILLAGPLVSRIGEVSLPPPGGDVIGLRRLDTHLLAFKALGARIKILESSLISIAVDDELVGASIFLEEASVTATENTILATVLAKGETIIQNAACEPHIQDLCSLLTLMGADISGIGSNVLRINGVDSLHGADFSIGSDYMEIGSFIGLAASTNSELLLSGVDREYLPMMQIGFRKLDISWELDGKELLVPKKERRTIMNDFGGMTPKIDDAPWPGFPADLLSIVTVTATQLQGTLLVHEKMFESRMYFIDLLIRMGANIILCDPHRAVVTGPTRLHGSLLTSPDVRAGMALVIAALAADGTSEIQNVYQIERGYESLCGKLQSIGASIIRTH